MSKATVSKGEVAAFLQAAWRGADTQVGRVAGIDEAVPEAIVFAQDEAALSRALQSTAGLILSKIDIAEDPRVIVVPDPRTSFARVYARWFDERRRDGVDPSALIENGAIVGKACEIRAYAQVCAGAVVGDDCVIGARVTILPGTTLGARVRVQAGAVLGSDGFGFVWTAEGHLGFPQLGTLWIGDDVEIGANSTIDRGALGETRIGRGTKIDNLVHIAHNCRIGEDVIIAAQVGIAGSTEVGDGAVLAGQVGLAEHVTVGPGVIVGAQGGVPTGKRLAGKGEVFWGTPARPIREYLRDLARLKRR